MTSCLVIAGASAVGKTTVAHRLIESGKYELVRSVTTREKRGDAFDAEYIYATRAEFESLMSSGGVLEHTEYAGYLYGTPRSEIERIAKDGKTPILILDLAGVKSISAAEGVSPCAIYLWDDLFVMERRLYDRYIGDAPSVEGLKKYLSRKNQNISDYLDIEKFAPHFFAFVKGGTVEESAEAIENALRDFLDGKKPDIEKNLSTAREMRESAAKIQ